MTSGRLFHLLTHPIYAARLIGYWVYEKRHPDEPWIAQGAVRFCEQKLDRSSDGLEFGSGRSTAWFAKRLRALMSVEHDRAWHSVVAERLKMQQVSNVDYRCVPLNHPIESPTYSHYDVTPDYIRVAEAIPDGSLGLVIVDGHYRQACVLAVISKIKPGGFLLIDNSNRVAEGEWGVPADWELVHRSENVRTETSIWQRPL